MGKSKFADFLMLYSAVAVTVAGQFAVFAKMYLIGFGCVAGGAATFAFDRWARKRGY